MVGFDLRGRLPTLVHKIDGWMGAGAVGSMAARSVAPTTPRSRSLSPTTTPRTSRGATGDSDAPSARKCGDKDAITVNHSTLAHTHKHSDTRAHIYPDPLQPSPAIWVSRCLLKVCLRRRQWRRPSTNTAPSTPSPSRTKIRNYIRSEARGLGG